MPIDNDESRRLSNLISAAVHAYEKGARINDSMTMAEARWLNFGRKFAESFPKAKPLNPKVIDANDNFRGDRS